MFATYWIENSALVTWFSWKHWSKKFFALLRREETMGRHWKLVNIWMINPSLSLCIWLMYRVRALLYGQWDQLAQFAVTLRLDMRFFLRLERQKGTIFGYINRMKKTLTHILLLDHNLQCLSLTKHNHSWANSSAKWQLGNLYQATV